MIEKTSESDALLGSVSRADVFARKTEQEVNVPNKLASEASNEPSGNNSTGTPGMSHPLRSS